MSDLAPVPAAEHELPLFQNERPMLGEPGVRFLRQVFPFSLDQMLEGRANRLMDAAPAPSGLTDAQLEMAVNAFWRLHSTPGMRRERHRKYLQRVMAEQDRRAAAGQPKAAA